MCPSACAECATSFFRLFRVILDTSAVLEHNEIDAVEVHGDDPDGAPESTFTPACASATSNDCW